MGRKKNTEVVPVEEPVAPFDYAALTRREKDKLKLMAGCIEKREKRVIEDILANGRDFAYIRDLLAHNKAGGFEAWVAHHGWSRRTAYRYMEVFETFGNCATVAQLSIDPGALYALSGPSVPEEAREEAVARAEAGEHITGATAREIAAEARTAGSDARAEAQAEKDDATFGEPTPSDADPATFREPEDDDIDADPLAVAMWAGDEKAAREKGKEDVAEEMAAEKEAAITRVIAGGRTGILEAVERCREGGFEAEAERLLEAIREPKDETEEDAEEEEQPEAQPAGGPAVNGRHEAEAIAPDAILAPKPPVARYEVSFVLPEGADEGDGESYVREALRTQCEYVAENDPMAALDTAAVRVEIAR